MEKQRKCHKTLKKEFFSKEASIKHMSQFDPFSPISFGKSTRSIGLFFFIPIHACRAPRGMTGGGRQCACFMSPKT